MRPLVLLAFGLLAPANAAAQIERYVVPRLTGPITLDGRSGEAAWDAVAPLAVTMHSPSFGGTPTERTELRIGHTQTHLYVAGRMYDSDVGGIQAPALNRDHLSTSSDWLSVVLDTFDDNENALLFGTTPSGLRTDYEIRGDAQAPNNVSWNTFWDVAVVRDDRGWFAEFRIPFSSLRFQPEDGEVAMGLIIWRYIARKNEVAIFPAIPPNWGFFSINKPSMAQKVVLKDVDPSNPAYFRPYISGGMGQTASLEEDGNAYESATQTVREVGLDFKYAVTRNLTLDLTLNTDFAQVEADDEQVNLSRFSLFFRRSASSSRNVLAFLSSILASPTGFSTAAASDSPRERRSQFTGERGSSDASATGIWVFSTCRPKQRAACHPRISVCFGHAVAY